MRHIFKSALLAFAVAFSLLEPVVAGPFEEAEAAYDRKDYTTALRLLRPLADQGDAKAQYILGLMYYFGNGLPEDFAAAFKWYRMAAEQGHVEAQFFVAVMYQHGAGVPKDYAVALKWYRSAADQGNPRAQYSLGVEYKLGYGVPQDYVQAYMWFILAVARFPATQAEERDKATETRDEIALKMTPAQIAEAKRLASEWKPTTKK